jgi:uncharacterized protein
VEIKYYKNVAEFWAGTGRYLARDEARYGRILGMAQAVLRMPHLFRLEDLLFCSVNTNKKINAVTVMVRPGELLIGYFTGRKRPVAEKLTAAAFESYKEITGVGGEKEITDIFAELWCLKNNVKNLSSMQQLLFRLDMVNSVPMTPGKLRSATMADKELVMKWSRAFSVDVEGGATRNMGMANLLPVIEAGWAFFWELDGNPVSMAMQGAPTYKGMSVHHVYTPPEYRGKGYATSCVAELSRGILKSGKEFCILSTDLANPTSNSIYQKIGYKPVCDEVWHAFEIPVKST